MRGFMIDEHIRFYSQNHLDITSCHFLSIVETTSGFHHIHPLACLTKILNSKKLIQGELPMISLKQMTELSGRTVRSGCTSLPPTGSCRKWIRFTKCTGQYLVKIR